MLKNKYIINNWKKIKLNYIRSKYVPSEELSKKYITAARKTINLLSEAPYYSGETNQALLLHSTGHLPHDSEIDIPIIYADYYFMEALPRLQKMDENSSQLAKS